MKYNKLGNTDLLVSEIGFGVLTVGNTQLNLPVEEGAKLIIHAMDKGINFLDTAEYYETYDYIRYALDTSTHKPIICSKSLGRSSFEMTAAIDDGLEALGIEYFDIFLMHEVRHDGDLKSRSGALRALLEAKNEGKVKYIGLSTHHVDVVKEAATVKDLDVIFPLINYSSLGIRNGADIGTKEDMEKAIQLNASEGKGIFLMKVFGGGNLTGNYMKSLNYAKSIKEAASLMIGFGKTMEVDMAIDFVDGKLPEDFQPDISKKKITIDQGDCEHCFACLNKCPNKAMYVDEYGNIAVNHAVCITCGYCAPVCPTRALLLL